MCWEPNLIMGFIDAVVHILNKNKKWIVGGAILYLIPVIYRLTMKNSIVPILDKTLFLYHRNSQIIPVNLETLGTLFLIPSAVGAVLGTTLLENIFNRRLTGFERYLSRVFGSLSFAFLWITIQFIGFNFFNSVAPWGSSLWSSPDVYARNLLVALIVAPLVPYIIELALKIKMRK